MAALSWFNRLSVACAKAFLQDLLRGLRYMHTKGFLHRDVKPSNCLVDGQGVLRLGDFGLARIYSKQEMTHEVASRWYRAPELLFGCRLYDCKVDVWSAGCVMAELLSGCGSAALFSGDGDIDQISRIFHVLGTPNEENWPGHERALPDWGKISFVPCEGVGLQAYFPDAGSEALDLLHGLLTLCPEKRLTADEALMHGWFMSEPLPHRLDVSKVLNGLPSVQ